MKLLRLSPTWLHYATLTQTKVETFTEASPAVAEFRFFRFGNGTQRKPNFLVQASLDDAIAIIDHLAAAGTVEARQMKADLDLGSSVRKLVGEQQVSSLVEPVARTP